MRPGRRGIDQVQRGGGIVLVIKGVGGQQIGVKFLLGREQRALGFQFGAAQRRGLSGVAPHFHQVERRQQPRLADLRRLGVGAAQQLVVGFKGQVDRRNIAQLGRGRVEHLAEGVRQPGAIAAQPGDPAQQTARRHDIAAVRIVVQIAAELALSSRHGAGVDRLERQLAIVTESVGLGRVDVDARHHIARRFPDPRFGAVAQGGKSRARAREIVAVEGGGRGQIGGEIPARGRTDGAGRQLDGGLGGIAARQGMARGGQQGLFGRRCVACLQRGQVILGTRIVAAAAIALSVDERRAVVRCRRAIVEDGGEGGKIERRLGRIRVLWGGGVGDQGQVRVRQARIGEQHQQGGAAVIGRRQEGNDIVLVALDQRIDL